MTVKIIADSTCDLTEELVQKHNIEVLPLHILLGEQAYEDGINIYPDDIYKWSDEHNATPSTSAPSLMEAMDVYKKFQNDYDQIVVFTIAKSMSSTFNVFRLAAEELEIEDRVYIVNSKNLSAGIGLMILKAAEMVEEGLDGEEIYSRMRELLPKIRTSFVVDTLTYLHRGGRCSSIAAFAGSALKLHPMIVVENGAMHASKKYRGNINRVYEQYAADLDRQLQEADKSRVFLVHSGCDNEIIAAIAARLEAYQFDEVLISRAGGVISSHCGPATLGIIYIED